MPVLPPSSNRDLEIRIAQSRGLITGERLLTRYERPGNFNPGWGTDTWRDGENVTWTLENRGLQDVTSGVTGPVSYPGFDFAARDVLAPVWSTRQGLAGMTRAPVVLVPSLTGSQAGATVEEMQRMANRQFTQARVRAGLLTRRPPR